jgi:hypothetical protein
MKKNENGCGFDLVISLNFKELRLWQVSLTGFLGGVSFDNWEVSWKTQGFKYSRSWQGSHNAPVEPEA